MKQIKNLKSFSTSADRFEGAHLLCPGCAHSIIVREILNATNDNLVVSASTGCLEVCTAIYPHTSWDCSWIHIGFENGSTAISGVEAANKALRAKGRISADTPEPKFVAFGGDGSTYDIGFQWLSGAVERGHDFTYVCLDNEVYANTGGQRSSSTPIGASATTTPAGTVSYGEKRNKKEQNLIQGNTGLFIDGGGENVKDIYVFENPLDLIAYRLLKGQENNLDRNNYYMATMGALENTTKETLEYIFNHYPTANIHICMPNNKRGKEIKKEILDMIRDRETEIRTDLLPYGKDWYNTFILKQKQKNSKIKKDKGYKDIGF